VLLTLYLLETYEVLLALYAVLETLYAVGIMIYAVPSALYAVVLIIRSAVTTCCGFNNSTSYAVLEILYEVQ
jgi:hypothetical protein